MVSVSFSQLHHSLYEMHEVLLVWKHNHSVQKTLLQSLRPFRQADRRCLDIAVYVTRASVDWEDGDTCPTSNSVVSEEDGD